MPLIDIQTGARLHYEDSASASDRVPVILIHGMLGTARGHLGHVMDWLAAKGFRVIGFTLRGYGQSLPKPRDFPDDFYQRDCEDLLAFMDALDISRAHLLGYSDGGEVALIAAGKAPSRIASCIAIGAIGSFGPDLRSVFQRSYPGDWITKQEKQEHGFTDAAKFTGAWVRATNRIIDAGGDISLSLAERVSCPLIIMLGKDDKLNPQAYGERFVARVPLGRLEMFDCGHAVHDEAREEFYRLTIRHLRESSPSQ